MSDAPVLRITDRLRGKYTLAVNDGAGLLDGSDTFTRQFETPPIQHEAAALIEKLTEVLKALEAAARGPVHLIDGASALEYAAHEARDAIAKAEG